MTQQQKGKFLWAKAIKSMSWPVTLHGSKENYFSYAEKKDTEILRSVSTKDACHRQLQSITIVIPRVNKVICLFAVH